MSDFDTYFKILTSANYAEDVFGEIKESELHNKFTSITKIIHPDKWFSSPDFFKKATIAFQKLQEFEANAAKAFKDNSYGKRNIVDKVIISTKKNIYTLEKEVAAGDISQVYLAKNKLGNDVIIKIVNNPRNNDLIDTEKANLSFMYDDINVNKLPVMKHIVPNVIDHFQFIQDKVNRNALVFPYVKNMVTIEEIIKSYPKGVDIRDAAWMINRILAALMIPYGSNIVHGAVVPNNILLELSTHNGILLDWAFSVKKDTKLSAVSSKYKEWYPKEVFDKLPVNNGLDLYMVAKLFLKLIGGDIKTNQFPTNTPKNIEGLFRACLIGPKHRIVDPYELYTDFAEALNVNYGKRSFRPFRLNN